MSTVCVREAHWGMVTSVHHHHRHHHELTAPHYRPLLGGSPDTKDRCEILKSVGTHDGLQVPGDRPRTLPLRLLSPFRAGSAGGGAHRNRNPGYHRCWQSGARWRTHWHLHTGPLGLSDRYTTLRSLVMRMHASPRGQGRAPGPAALISELEPVAQGLHLYP